MGQPNTFLAKVLQRRPGGGGAGQSGAAAGQSEPIAGQSGATELQLGPSGHADTDGALATTEHEAEAGASEYLVEWEPSGDSRTYSWEPAEVLSRLGWQAATAATAGARETQIGGSGGSLEPPGPFSCAPPYRSYGIL